MVDELRVALASNPKTLGDIPEYNIRLSYNLYELILKPIKEGCTADVGNIDLLDDFYNVFSSNMRDLGSPVHPKKLFKNILSEFPEEARICLAI